MQIEVYKEQPLYYFICTGRITKQTKNPQFKLIWGKSFNENIT